MKKKNVLWVILNLVFLVIFNVFFFVLGGNNHPLSVWISYGFIHFAYFMLLLTPKLIGNGRNVVAFGFSLYSISTIYFLAEFVIGIIFTLFSPESYIAALLVQLGVVGLYVMGLVILMLANEYTSNAEEKRQSEIEYVKESSPKLYSILQRVSDREAAKKIERVYDLINSSPVKSNANVSVLEQQISSEIDRLESLIIQNNTEQIISVANKVFKLASERNRQLMNSNG